MLDSLIVSLMLLGAASGSGELPFWAVSNNYGLMPQYNGGVALFDAHTSFDRSKTFQWRAGVSLAGTQEFRPGLSDPKGNFIIDQMYGSLKWTLLTLDAGIIHRDRDFIAAGDPSLGSMSTTSGNLIWSSNSRSLPGYAITLDPLAVPWTDGRLNLYGRYGDYKTCDRRYVDGSYLHNTQIGLLWHITDRLDFRFALDHYAQWGGVSPLYGEMPLSFDNYLRVIMGRGAKSGASGSTECDIINVIGNQLGAELLRLDWRGDGWTLTAQHDIPYDDGSGMGLQNFPDGINTLHFGFDDKDRWVSDLLFEYGYTRYQSGTFHDKTDEHGNMVIYGGLDNYFNNGEYHSGWTYFGRTVGLPLFFPQGTRSGTWSPDGITMGVENNRTRYHHLAVAGKLWRKAPYKLMLTYSRNYGLYILPYTGDSQIFHEWGTVKETPLGQFSAAFAGVIPNLFGSKRISVNYGLFGDYGQVLRNTFGCTLGIGIKIY